MARIGSGPQTRDNLGKFEPGSDARRALLETLTANELRQLAEDHGYSQPVDSSCWGWGAVAVGRADAESSERCTKCGRKTATPLWFSAPYSGGAKLEGWCWSCALKRHLIECDAVGNSW